MSPNARAVVLALAALCVFGGALLLFEGNGGGVAALAVGLLMVVSVAFEGRYGRPGQEPTPASVDWQPTGEKFIDDETGEPIEVWMDKLTGERRYERASTDSRLPGPRP
jgi:hypothetical protein